LQTLLIFVVALAVGTHFAGDYLVAVPIAILIGVVVVLASIALGLIISSFVDDPEQASNLGTLIVVPLSFFTGVYFNMDLSATRYLPWTQGATAMRQALLFNNWGTAMAATLICLLGAGVMFVMGVLLFKYKRLGGG
jgi:ABC-type multidrug transport system permease subunit